MGQENNRPLILVTNDDGYRARGLRTLTDIAAEFGDVVAIAAPDSQSGMSHAITIKYPLRLRHVEDSEGMRRYVVNGTPVDGVKLAMCSILERRPDLVLSGINHGSNASSSVVYSGTMAAAMEGAVNHIPSIGFSLLDYRHDADFRASVPYVRKIIGDVLRDGMPDGVCLNVNIPAVGAEELEGVRICRQASGYWQEEFDVRKDPSGREYFWLTGYFFNREEEAEDTDEWALRHNYVSVVPVKVDLTDYKTLSLLKKWETKKVNNESR